MNWAELSKEEQQKYILIVSVVVAVVGGGIYFGIMPILNMTQKMNTDIEKLQSQISTGKTLIKQLHSLKNEYADKRKNLKIILKNFLPPKNDTYLHSIKKINAYGHDINLIAEKIDPVSPTKTDADDVFQPYAIQVLLICGYTKLLNFLEIVEKDNPYANFKLIQVTGTRDDYEHHQINLIIEYPYYTGSVENELVKEILREQ